MAALPPRMLKDDVDEETNRLTGLIVDACIEVHRVLGPGLLESSYQAALAHELALRGLRARSHAPLSLTYKGLALGKAYEADIVVEERVVVEIKSVETLHKVHFAQLSTYLKLMGVEVGLLVNFDTAPLKSGIHRVVRRRP